MVQVSFLGVLEEFGTLSGEIQSTSLLDALSFFSARHQSDVAPTGRADAPQVGVAPVEELPESGY